MFGFGYQYSAIKGGESLGQIIFDAYSLRVESDGGIVENETCATNAIKQLTRIQ